MTDHFDPKAIADELRAGCGNGCKTASSVMHRAADTIDALVKERGPDDVQALIDEARGAVLTMDYERAYQGGLIGRLADALEAAEKELAMRRSESADFERERDELAAVIEDALTWMDAGDGRLTDHPLWRVLSAYTNTTNHTDGSAR